ncbi:ParB N-terminal domain-containing protein [Oleidesulfovibrio alaskensis]|uniref:plasmid partitioning protein RepB C-terminal domain-containing protein n=1 Tax=Oleidesulfovibrio alaskensis TaxID=58180 RepID=UPI0004064AEE|nr:ParB N-terminal domain-containing protein [Oleidesulfovibrio alaskensis]
MKTSEIILVPVEEVHILNPRVRNQVIADEIRRNIRTVGLKRPITVTLSTDPKTGKKYDLVCGQGRLEAFMDAGETEIPAIIIDADKENAHIMSLVENIARRNNNPMELLHGIRYLKAQGYDDVEIADKTGLGRDWIRGIIKLLDNGEERLVNAVEKGRMPLYIALKIATEDEAAIQIALTEAYETGQLVGGKLIAVQKLLDRRNHYGKKLSAPKSRKAPSVDELNALYANDIKRKKRLMAKADQLRQILAYTSAALNKLLRDEHFTNQLKAEGMNDIPRQLAEMLREVR